MAEFSASQYAKSGVEVALVAGQEIVHLAHCLGQLSVMYAQEKVRELDTWLADYGNVE